jgi:hypothetical protein
MACNSHVTNKHVGKSIECAGSRASNHDRGAIYRIINENKYEECSLLDTLIKLVAVTRYSDP